MLNSNDARSFYKGSLLFLPISELYSIPIDQINFFVGHLYAMTMGILMYILLPPKRTSPLIRHLYEIVFGLLLSFFNHGSDTVFLLFPCLVTYVLMLILPSSILGYVICFFNMFFLTYVHLKRVFLDYGHYTLDFSGPLMILVQKLTSLALSYSDGLLNKNNLLSHSILKPPSLLELTSYSISFHSLLCGPFYFFDEYINFIKGIDQMSIPDGYSFYPKKLIMKRIMRCCMFFFATLLIPLYVTPEVNLGPSFADLDFLTKNFYVVLVCVACRYKYYFAWSLGELDNLVTGMGFSGINKKKELVWENVNNFNFFNIEFGSNPRVLLNNWNISTGRWLRFLIYQRTHSTWLVFLFSAFWHGLYPGYYIAFITTALFLTAFRRLKTISLRVPLPNRVIFFFSIGIVQLLLCYSAFPFVLLLFQPVFFIYKHLYFYLHIINVILIIVSYLLPTSYIDQTKRKPFPSFPNTNTNSTTNVTSTLVYSTSSTNNVNNNVNTLTSNDNIGIGGPTSGTRQKVTFFKLTPHLVSSPNNTNATKNTSSKISFSLFNEDKTILFNGNKNNKKNNTDNILKNNLDSHNINNYNNRCDAKIFINSSNNCTFIRKA